jgi:hypothetical protein
VRKAGARARDESLRPFSYSRFSILRGSSESTVFYALTVNRKLAILPYARALGAPLSYE